MSKRLLIIAAAILFSGCEKANIEAPQVEKSMYDQILQPSDVWKDMYPTEDPNDSKKVYNLKVVLELLKRQGQVITQLQRRVTGLEAAIQEVAFAIKIGDANVPAGGQ